MRRSRRAARERGIVFTVVPTNSYYLRTLAPERWALDHPIRRMAALGLRIHPNTDDPALHHVTPTGAWQMMVRDFGFGLDDLRGFMLNGIDAAWIDEDQRRALAHRVGRALRQPARAAANPRRNPEHVQSALHLLPAPLRPCVGAGRARRSRPGPRPSPSPSSCPSARAAASMSRHAWWARSWRERLKQSVVVENVAGAGGTIGVAKAAHAAPDGYTLVLGADSPIAIARLVNPAAVKYDALKDLAPVGLVTTAPMVLVARPGLPANTLAEVLKLAKQQSGQAQLRHFGHRHRAAPGDGTDQGPGQGLHHPRALSRRRADRHRRGRQPGGPGDAGQRHGDAQHPGQEDEGHRRHRRQAPADSARRTDGRRDARLQGLRRGGLDRAVRARRKRRPRWSSG